MCPADKRAAACLLGGVAHPVHQRHEVVPVPERPGIPVLPGSIGVGRTRKIVVPQDVLAVQRDSVFGGQVPNKQGA